MTRKKKELSEPEWSHFVEAEKVGTTPLKMTIGPGPEERKRLAKRIGVAELTSLESDVVMSRDAGSNVIFVSGQIRANVVQASVVSAKPVKGEILDSFEAWFADKDQAVSFAKAKQERLTKEGQNDLPFLDESEDPEPVVNGMVDVGELVAQYLSLAINPYPRLEGEHYKYGDDEKSKAPKEVADNPFAALKDWKKKQENPDS
jgi:uncharacterized metal-binding protein YceD (DUF177 family)